MADIAGQTILITGAMRGVGATIVERLVREGEVNIALLAKDKAEATDDTLSKYRRMYNTDVRFFATDMLDSDSIKDSIQRVASTFGGIDVVINAAAVIVIKSVANTDVDIMDLSYNINARSCYLVCKHAFEFLAKSAQPQVLNICPPINLDPRVLATRMAYCTSQYMKSMITVALAESDDWQQHGIRVNGLWPLYPFEDGENLSIYQAHTEKTAQKRSVKLFGDAAHCVLSRPENGWNGEFFYDEEIIDMHRSGEADNIIEHRNTQSVTQDSYALEDDF